MKNTSHKLLTLLFFMILSLEYVNADNDFSFSYSGGHKNNITAFAHNNETVISADEDGYIVIWDVRTQAASVRFQLTPYSIKYMVNHPAKSEICIVADPGGGQNIITAWNYKTKKRIFNISSDNPISYINYSANGNYIISSGFNGNCVTLINSETGEVLNTPDVPIGNVSLTVTGRAGRNIMIYQSKHNDYSFIKNNDYEGQLLYYDLNSDSVTNRIGAPGELSKVIAFNNNRYLAGVSAKGIVVFDATTGLIIDTIANNSRNALLCQPLLGAEDFYALTGENGNYNLNRYIIQNSRLTVNQRQSFSYNNNNQITLFAYNESVVFSDKNNLNIVNRQGVVTEFKRNINVQIKDIAQTGGSIALITENSVISFIPHDYHLIENINNIVTEKSTGYTNVTPHPDKNKDKFILWQNTNTRLAPAIIDSDFNRSYGNLRLSNRFPLRLLSYLDNRLLSLDSAGNISVYTIENNEIKTNFTTSSIGTIDASFIDDAKIITGRSAVTRNSIFLQINYKTGETVPIPYSADAGIFVFTDNSKNIYGGALKQTDNGLYTVIINISSNNAVILESPGEAVFTSSAKSSESIAISFGSEGAMILKSPINRNPIIYFERTEGLPVKLLAFDKFFISLTSDGSIAWHDNNTGKLLAVFSLYENSWTLTTSKNTSGKLLLK